MVGSSIEFDRYQFGNQLAESRKMAEMWQAPDN
jgi:hypothetical protein